MKFILPTISLLQGFSKDVDRIFEIRFDRLEKSPEIFKNGSQANLHIFFQSYRTFPRKRKAPKKFVGKVTTLWKFVEKKSLKGKKLNFDTRDRD